MALAVRAAIDPRGAAWSTADRYSELPEVEARSSAGARRQPPRARRAAEKMSGCPAAATDPEQAARCSLWLWSAPRVLAEEGSGILQLVPGRSQGVGGRLPRSTGTSSSISPTSGGPSCHCSGSGHGGCDGPATAGSPRSACSSSSSSSSSSPAVVVAVVAEAEDAERRVGHREFGFAELDVLGPQPTSASC